jgi:hypothetical protein
MDAAHAIAEAIRSGILPTQAIAPNGYPYPYTPQVYLGNAIYAASKSLGRGLTPEQTLKKAEEWLALAGSASNGKPAKPKQPPAEDLQKDQPPDGKADDSWTADAGAFFLNFFKDSNGIYHAKPDTWQSIGGYTDFYDEIFDAFTSMVSYKFPFRFRNDAYIFWIWKGDYLNLGAGAELGIYSSGTSADDLYSSYIIWQVDYSLAMPMTLSLYLGNTNLFRYLPAESQWWITGFNPSYKNIEASDLSAIATVDMSNNPEMFNAFCSAFASNPEWAAYISVNYQSKIVTFQW